MASDVRYIYRYFIDGLLIFLNYCKNNTDEKSFITFLMINLGSRKKLKIPRIVSDVTSSISIFFYLFLY